MIMKIKATTTKETTTVTAEAVLIWKMV